MFTVVTAMIKVLLLKVIVIGQKTGLQIRNMSIKQKLIKIKKMN